MNLIEFKFCAIFGIPSPPPWDQLTPTSDNIRGKYCQIKTYLVVFTLNVGSNESITPREGHTTTIE